LRPKFCALFSYRSYVLEPISTPISFFSLWSS
jgi:hypothetical protein